MKLKHLKKWGFRLSLAANVLLFLLLLGALKPGQPPARAEVARAPETEAMSVRVRTLEAAPVVREVRIHGVSAPARTVVLRAETNGMIVSIGKPRGAYLEAGDLICSIDIRDREENLLQARAMLRQRELEYQAALDLASKGLQAESRVAAALANLENARAQLKSIEIDIDSTTIQAPFSGMLQERMVEVGDYVMPGQEIAVIVENDPLIITGGVTEQEIESLSIGSEGAAVFATGERREGFLRYTAPAADQASRTFTVEMELENPGNAIPSGITAEVAVPAGEVMAHRVPASVLALNDEGLLGVKLVDGDSRARFAEADIVKTSEDEVWLAGLPQQATIITLGQGFITEGDIVNPVPETKAENLSRGDTANSGASAKQTRGVAQPATSNDLVPPKLPQEKLPALAKPEGSTPADTLSPPVGSGDDDITPFREAKAQTEDFRSFLPSSEEDADTTASGSDSRGGDSAEPSETEPSRHEQP